LPAILRAFSLDLPFDFTTGGENGHFAATIVTAEQGACGEEAGRQQGKGEKDVFHAGEVERPE
jgi:hypothetical protein